MTHLDAATTATVCRPGEQALAGLHKPRTAEEQHNYPEATAALWTEDALWTANESGLLTRWNVQDTSYEQHRIPDGSVVRSLAAAGSYLAAGTDTRLLWILAQNGWRSMRACSKNAVTSMTQDVRENLWCACPGEGLVMIPLAEATVEPQLIAAPPAIRDALQGINAVAYAPMRDEVWVATRSGELFHYAVSARQWLDRVTLPGQPVVYALLAEMDGPVWIATSAGVYVYRDRSTSLCFPNPNPVTFDTPVLSLARSVDGTLWVAGKDHIARIVTCDAAAVYTDVDNPVLLERHKFVVLDKNDTPWFVGRRGKVHFDGTVWHAIDADVRRQAIFVPIEPTREVLPPPHSFPSPSASYLRWLQTWPRPRGDNGRGIHFLQTHQYDAIEAQRQVNRMVSLGVRWALVQYADHEQLVRTAPIFQAAGITVVWRPFVRPYQTYVSWAEDVGFLRGRGIAPYMQLYNEPELEQEWDGLCAVSQKTYLHNLLPAAQQVYEAGGYVGLQLINPDWLRATLREMKAAKMHYIFERMFFVPHLHGLNHPPHYVEDIHGVLGFREFARVFEEELGFIPVMIAGEGGWRLGEQQDDRFPAITEALHRDYHLEVFNWFRTGRLSDGKPLPDYLFAFCPWLISDPVDPAAWFDSTAGDRQLTIEAVASMPTFERKFSWDD